MTRRSRALVAVCAAVAVAGAATVVWLLLPGTPAAVAAATLPHRQPVAAIAFSPDGRTLAAGEEYGGGDPVVRLWDYASGRTVGTLAGGGVGPSLAFSPDGTRLATAGYDCGLAVRLWRVPPH